MTKAEVISAMNEMSDSFALEELIERLIVVEKVGKAMHSLDEGKGIPHSQVLEEMKGYMKKRKDGEDNMVA